MGFFDTFGNKVISAGNQLSSRAKDTGEQLRLANENQNLNRQLAMFYQQAGEMYYNQQRGTAQVSDADFETIFSSIDRIKAHIQNNEKAIAQLKSQIACPCCGKMIPYDTKFCPYCGVPVTSDGRYTARDREPKVISDTPVSIEKEQLVNGPMGQQSGNTVSSKTGGFCPYCGAPMEAGAKFCTSCGRPVGNSNAMKVHEIENEKPDSEEADQERPEISEAEEGQNMPVSPETDQMTDADLQTDSKHTQEEQS